MQVFRDPLEAAPWKSGESPKQSSLGGGLGVDSLLFGGAAAGSVLERKGSGPLSLSFTGGARPQMRLNLPGGNTESPNGPQSPSSFMSRLAMKLSRANGSAGGDVSRTADDGA